MVPNRTMSTRTSEPKIVSKRSLFTLSPGEKSVKVFTFPSRITRLEMRMGYGIKVPIVSLSITRDLRKVRVGDQKELILLQFV